MSERTMPREEAPPERNRRRPWLRAAAAVVALAVLDLVGRELGGYVPRFARWVDSLGVWGPLVFILGYAAATVAPGRLQVETGVALALDGDLWQTTVPVGLRLGVVAPASGQAGARVVVDDVIVSWERQGCL